MSSWKADDQSCLTGKCTYAKVLPIATVSLAGNHHLAGLPMQRLLGIVRVKGNEKSVSLREERTPLYRPCSGRADLPLEQSRLLYRPRRRMKLSFLTTWPDRDAEDAATARMTGCNRSSFLWPCQKNVDSTTVAICRTGSS